MKTYEIGRLYPYGYRKGDKLTDYVVTDLVTGRLFRVRKLGNGKWRANTISGMRTNECATRSEAISDMQRML